MSGKRPSLAETMRQAAQQPVPDAPPPVPSPAPKTAAKAPAAPAAPASLRPRGFHAATRAGKKKVTAALDPAWHKQLKGLAVEREQTTEALLLEAIGDLFRKYGKPAQP